MDFTSSGLVASLIVGTIGSGIFAYGKKQSRGPQLFAGLLIMAISWVVADPLWMSVSAGGVIAALWAGTRHGF